MKVDNVLVVGGSGFIGRHLVAALAARGITVTVPTRRRERAKHLIMLPTVEVVEADVFAPGALERLAARASRRSSTSSASCTAGAAGPTSAARTTTARISRASTSSCRRPSSPPAARPACARLLHMSALGASPTRRPSTCAPRRSASRRCSPRTTSTCTVFRPSVVFGPEDRFLNQFAALARFLPVLAVPCPHAQFQPVYVGDVARAMLAALDDPETARQGLRAVRPARVHA